MPSLPECAICLDDLCGVDQWGQDKSISALGCGTSPLVLARSPPSRASLAALALSQASDLLPSNPLPNQVTHIMKHAWPRRSPSGNAARPAPNRPSHPTPPFDASSSPPRTTRLHPQLARLHSTVAEVQARKTWSSCGEGCTTSRSSAISWRGISRTLWVRSRRSRRRGMSSRRESEGLLRWLPSR